MHEVCGYILPVLPTLPMGTACREGKVGNWMQRVGGGGVLGGAKHVGRGRVQRLFCIHELACSSLDFKTEKKCKILPGG